MVQEIILEYGKALLFVIGGIEFVNKARETKLSKNWKIILQVIFSLVAGILNGLSGWADGFTVGLVVLIISKFGMVLVVSTLFYQLGVKKIRDAGGKIRG